MNREETRPADPVRPADAAAVELAGKLLTEARLAALGTIDPQDGYPLVSRIAVAASEGWLYFLASDLSLHARALQRDPRASLLLGEPGKGDPLAHPRITIVGEAVKLAGTEHGRLRSHWLEAHPRAVLYIDFADFHFYRLEPVRANLNGGFGKAFFLTAEQVRESLS